jgi:DNA-directed RNA polymerase subunit alpha
MFTITIPDITVDITNKGQNIYSLTITPLLPGFGHTLGNSLRRVFLSSIPGFGISKIRIGSNGKFITHEYQTIDGVVEDAMDMILNLKQIRAKILTSDDSVVMVLKQKGGEVRAQDFEKNAKVEICNPDQYICTLNEKADIEIEIEITKGVGYHTVSKKDLSNNPNLQEILVDTLYSPVTNVSLDVEQTRVGENTDFDKLILNFTLDATVEAKDVCQYAVSFVTELYQKIAVSLGGVINTTKTAEPEVVKKVEKVEEEKVVVEEKASPDIKLPAKIISILNKNGIFTNKELLERQSEVSEFTGLGEKMMAQINEYLSNI